MSSWTDTALWQELSHREGEPASSLCKVVSDILPDVETILSAGGTTETDFTLHDSEHAFRVAERMAALLGPTLLAEVSSHDLAQLLLSAYLHDIGMTPPQGKVFAHYAFLLSGDGANLSVEERDHLQAWLDDLYDGLVPPIADGTPAPDDLRLARWLSAEYSRHRHNDWSEEWIREHLAACEADLYPGWLDDLVALCRSHHGGLVELRQSRFDPRLVGSPAEVLHLRYCACVLRVADVLDFDPERTPRVIFDHRDVDDRSAIFWHKDHELSFSQEETRLILHASPGNALIHKAIEDTVAAVNTELVLCRRLADETHFHRATGQEHDLPHRWRLETAVHARIEPLNGSYVYIDGTFRPNTGKVLQLLGGLDLYGSPLAAVREILQNAFDAVREQIAMERLGQPDPGAASTGTAVRALHSVHLRLETAEETLWLTCTDTGTGMSKQILTDRFLVSGASPSHESRELEREAQAHGFTVGRTARFGIGVLTYFLLGSRLTLRTRRTTEAGDAEGVGWRFETRGLTDFGELRRDPDCRPGSEIRLQLRSDVVGTDFDKFAQDLRRSVDQILERVPCRFSFEAPGLGVPPLALEPGWHNRTARFADSLRNSLTKERWTSREPLPAELLSSRRREEREEAESHWEDVRGELVDALRWEIEEGELPARLGGYRISVPYFELSGGRALAFLRAMEMDDDGIGLRRLGDGHLYTPNGELHMGWNGMAVGGSMSKGIARGFELLDQETVFAQVDWTDDAAGTIAVHRTAVSLSPAGNDGVRFVSQRATELVSALVREAAASKYALLNHRIAGTEPGREGTMAWIDESGEAETWTDLKFPAVDAHGPMRYFLATDADAALWRGEPVRAVPTLRSFRDRYLSSGISWHGSMLGPTHVVASKYFGRPWIVPLWAADPRRQDISHAAGVIAEFPPEWRQLCGCLFAHGVSDDPELQVWNGAHPLLAAVDSESFRWAVEAFAESLDPLPHVGDVMRSPGRAAAWILMCLSNPSKDLWDGLGERNARFLPEVWGMIFGSGTEGDEPVYYWFDHSTQAGLRTLTPAGWTRIDMGSREDELTQYLPEPSGEWSVTQAHAASSHAEGHRASRFRLRRS